MSVYLYCKPIKTIEISLVDLCFSAAGFSSLMCIYSLLALCVCVCIGWMCGFYILALLGNLSHLHWLLYNLALLGWIDPFDRMAYVALTLMVFWYSCVMRIP